MSATVIDLVDQSYGLVQNGEIASNVYSRIIEEAKRLGKDVPHGIRLIYAGREIEKNNDPIKLLSKEELDELPGNHKGSHDKIAMVIKLSSGGGRLRRIRKSKRKSKRSSKRSKSRRKSKRKSKRRKRR